MLTIFVLKFNQILSSVRGVFHESKIILPRYSPILSWRRAVNSVRQDLLDSSPDTCVRLQRSLFHYYPASLANSASLDLISCSSLISALNVSITGRRGRIGKNKAETWIFRIRNRES